MLVDVGNKGERQAARTLGEKRASRFIPGTNGDKFLHDVVDFA